MKNDQTPSSESPSQTCSADSPTFDEIVAARKIAYEKFDFPAGDEETERQNAWMQWRRMRTTQDLEGYLWWLIENAIKMDSEMGQALLEIMSRLRKDKRRPLQMDAMVREILEQNARSMAAPEHAPKIDHTRPTASPSDPC